MGVIRPEYIFGFWRKLSMNPLVTGITGAARGKATQVHDAGY